MAAKKTLLETVKAEISAVVPEIKEKIVQKIIEKKVFNTALFGKTTYELFDVIRQKMLGRIVYEVCDKYKLHDEIVAELKKIVEQEFTAGRDLLVDNVVKILTKDIAKQESQEKK
jgi:hypothetical protein